MGLYKIELIVEKQIQKTAFRLKRIYLLFWILPILVILTGECDGAWVGMYAENIRISYLTETIGILLAASSVPLALKLFSWVLTKKIDTVSLPRALRLYFQWSGVRLLVLEIAVIVNFCIYYLTLSNTGLLCALIALTASLFCVPSEKRLREELHIDKEESI